VTFPPELSEHRIDESQAEIPSQIVKVVIDTRLTGKKGWKAEYGKGYYRNIPDSEKNEHTPILSQPLHQQIPHQPDTMRACYVYHAGIGCF